MLLFVRKALSGVSQLDERALDAPHAGRYHERNAQTTWKGHGQGQIREQHLQGKSSSHPPMLLERQDLCVLCLLRSRHQPSALRCFQ